MKRYNSIYEKKPGIYAIENTENKKLYIGQSQNVRRRIHAHFAKLKSGKHNNMYLQNAFNKYGASCFVAYVLEYCSIDQLNDREIFWIDYHKTNIGDNGYNLTLGGEGNRGYKMSEETIVKIKQRLPDVSGKNNPMYGKSWKDYATEETIREHDEKIRRWNASHDSVLAKEVICLNTLKRYKSTKYAAADLSINHRSITMNCLGVTRRCTTVDGSEHYVFCYAEEYEKMSDEDVECAIKKAETPYSEIIYMIHRVKVINITTLDVYESVKEAANATGVAPSSISACLSGRSKSSGSSVGGERYCWMYHDDYVNASFDEICQKYWDAQLAKDGSRMPNARKVLCVTTNTVYKTVSEAGRILNLDPSSIVKCCKGKSKYSGIINNQKLVWKYVV